MELSVLNISGKDTGKKVELADEIFAIEPNDHVIYLDVKQHLANKRQGTHKAKERGEIKGSTKKIKRQKGTGTARAGSTKSPLLKGGGRVFGPRPRDYSFKLNKKLKKELRGDTLFTKYGVSGFAILDSSQLISYSLNNGAKVEISIDTIPKLTISDLISIFNSNLDLTIEDKLISIIPYKLLGVILKRFKIDKNLTLKIIGKKDIKKLIYGLKDFRLDISDTNGFETAEVTGGGIDTKDIKQNSMESKLIKNLYFTGEILDIVGERGGYNLHFAWSSGYLASKNIKKNLK